MFLVGKIITQSIRKLIGESSSLDCAVAFWGMGSENLLIAGSRRKKIRVICNLESGATNPDVIKILLTNNVEIRTNPRLHAKAWLGDSTGIIGSANASANGLGLEGNDAYWLEACTVISMETLSKAKQWFEKLWNHEGNTTINSSDDLEKYYEVWRKRRVSSRISIMEQTQNGLINYASSNSKIVGNRLFLAITSKEMDKDAEARLKEIMENNYEVTEAYQDWDLPKNAFLIDAIKGKGNSLNITGLYLVLDKAPVKIKREKFLTLVGKADDFDLVELSTEDKKRIKKMAKEILKKWPLDEDGARLIPFDEVATLCCGNPTE